MAEKRKRQFITTDLGEEAECMKCGDFWPVDPEFFYMSGGVPHTWCRACYLTAPCIVNRQARERERRLFTRLVREASA